jgi:hypothetical protein
MGRDRLKKTWSFMGNNTESFLESAAVRVNMSRGSARLDGTILRLCAAVVPSHKDLTVLKFVLTQPVILLGFIKIIRCRFINTMQLTVSGRTYLI